MILITLHFLKKFKKSESNEWNASYQTKRNEPWIAKEIKNPWNIYIFTNYIKNKYFFMSHAKTCFCSCDSTKF